VTSIFISPTSSQAKKLVLSKMWNYLARTTPGMLDSNSCPCRFYPANQPTQSGEARPARANEKAKPYYEGKTVKKVIVLPQKQVNIVAV
jgi:hypothetical protein